MVGHLKNGCPMPVLRMSNHRPQPRHMDIVGRTDDRCPFYGCPTTFPNPNSLGPTFNETVWHGMGRVMGRELRALWARTVAGVPLLRWPGR